MHNKFHNASFEVSQTGHAVRSKIPGFQNVFIMNVSLRFVISPEMSRDRTASWKKIQKSSMDMSTGNPDHEHQPSAEFSQSR